MGTTFQTAPIITYCHIYIWETRTTRSDISIGMDTRTIRLQKNSEAQSRAERPSRHTSSLFEGLYMQSNAARCIHKLNGTKAGLQAIQSVMRMNTSPAFIVIGSGSTSGVEGYRWMLTANFHQDRQSTDFLGRVYRCIQGRETAGSCYALFEGMLLIK